MFPPFDPHPERPSSGNGCDARLSVTFAQQAEKAETRTNRRSGAEGLRVRRAFGNSRAAWR